MTSVKDKVVRLITQPRDSAESQEFLKALAPAPDSTARAVITQLKKIIKDKSSPPTVKLSALKVRSTQLFHQCMCTNNVYYLVFAQKKILRRFGEFAKHRKNSADPNRGADIFGAASSSSEENRAASIEFLKCLLEYIMLWASRYGIAPNGSQSDYYKLYKILQTEGVTFPAPQQQVPARPASAAVPKRFQNDIARCKQTAEALISMLERDPGNSEVASTASQLNAYKTQLEVEIETRSNKDTSDVEMNMLLDAHDYLEKTLKEYETSKKMRATFPVLSVPQMGLPLQDQPRAGSGRLSQPILSAAEWPDDGLPAQLKSIQAGTKETQSRIDQLEQQLSEVRNRIFLLKTSEDPQNNPDKLKLDLELKKRELEEKHRGRMAALEQNVRNLGTDRRTVEQRLAELQKAVDQAQAALKQKSAEVERDNRMFEELTADNKAFMARLEERKRDVQETARANPPTSPNRPVSPTFFGTISARQSVESPQNFLGNFATQRPPGEIEVRAVEAVAPDSLPISNEKEFKLLCSQDQGLLFEDALIQIGMQLQMTAGQGKARVLVANKSKETVESVTLQVVQSSDGLSLQMEPKPPVSITPGEKSGYAFSIAASDVFAGCPRVIIAYM